MMETVFTAKRLDGGKVEVAMKVKDNTGAVMRVISKRFPAYVSVSVACRELVEMDNATQEALTDEVDCQCELCNPSDYG
jgi:hypothetical protein